MGAATVCLDRLPLWASDVDHGKTLPLAMGQDAMSALGTGAGDKRKPLLLGSHPCGLCTTIGEDVITCSMPAANMIANSPGSPLDTMSKVPLLSVTRTTTTQSSNCGADSCIAFTIIFTAAAMMETLIGSSLGIVI